MDVIKYLNVCKRNFRNNIFFAVYDIEHNQTSVAQKEQNPIVSVAQSVLTGLAQSGAMNMQRCTIMPCVRELLTSLRLPNEGENLKKT